MIDCGLIVSDFDGTLIDDNQKILPQVKSAIDEYVAAGGIFAVCTGRMMNSIMPRVKELGLKGLVIAYQGTKIADIETGKIIKDGGMEFESVAEICRFIEELGYFVNAYCGDVMYTDIPKDNIHLQTYERIVGIDSVSINGKISDFVLKNKLKCQKIACLVAENERIKLYSALNEKYGKKFDVTCSAKVLVEVSPLGDNKGEAIKFLAEHYNVPISKSVAIGDNLNDLSMILAAGVGCAVGNAEEELKSNANYVCKKTNNQGAVAEVIKKFGYRQN